MVQSCKLKELSFLVYGLGLSGRSVINFFKRNGIKKFKVWDDNKKNEYKKYRPKNLIHTFNQVDYIILSPGISLLKNKKLNKFKKKIITDIDLFYLYNDKFKSIVVTGTNGKSTTCKLIAHLLHKNNFKYSLGGNIGTPILNLKNFKNSYVIIETSSFQLLAPAAAFLSVPSWDINSKWHLFGLAIPSFIYPNNTLTASLSVYFQPPLEATLLAESITT
mgnify:CR=1 FL=1